MKGRSRTTTAPDAHFIPSPYSLPHLISILTVGEFDTSSAGNKPKKPHKQHIQSSLQQLPLIKPAYWQIVHMTWHDMNGRDRMTRRDEHTHTRGREIAPPAQLCHEAEKISRLLWRGGAAVRVVGPLSAQIMHVSIVVPVIVSVDYINLEVNCNCCWACSKRLSRL